MAEMYRDAANWWERDGERRLPASEFGGHVDEHGIAPEVTPRGDEGHVPTAAEQLRLTYAEGFRDGGYGPDWVAEERELRGE